MPIKAGNYHGAEPSRACALRVNNVRSRAQQRGLFFCSKFGGGVARVGGMAEGKTLHQEEAVVSQAKAKHTATVSGCI